jgi:hypothetical protein
MNLLQFIATMTASLAWPITIVVIIVILRKPLSSSIQSLRKLNYKDLQLDFSQEVAKLKVAADDAKLPYPPLIPGGELDVSGKRNERLPNDPSLAVILAWSRIEQALKSAVKRTNIVSENAALQPSLSAHQCIQLLASKNYIDRSFVKILMDMSKLGIEVTHQDTSAKQISEKDAYQYDTLAKRVIEKLRSLKNDVIPQTSLNRRSGPAPEERGMALKNDVIPQTSLNSDNLSSNDDVW